MVEIADSKYAYLFKNFLMFSIGTVGTKVISMALVPLYTYYISTSEFGIIDIVSTTDWILIYLFSLGVIDGFFRFALDDIDSVEDLFVFSKNVITIGFFVLLPIVVIVRYILPINYPDYHYIFLIVIFALNALNDLIITFYKVNDQINKVVVTGFLCAVTNFLAAIVFIAVLKWAGVGYYITICAGFSVSIIYGLINIKLRNITRIKSGISKKVKKEIFRYSIPLSVNAISLWINNAIDKYFIIVICGEDANGIYSAAFKVPAMLSIVQSVFADAWSLSAIKEYDNRDTDGFFKSAYSMFSTVLIFGCSFIILINVALTHLICQKDFSEAWHYSAFLVISVVFTALSGFMTGVFGALKITKYLAETTFFAAISNIILNIILIPRFGVYGATISTVFSCVIMFVARCIIITKKSNIKLPVGVSFICGAMLFVQACLEQKVNHCYLAQICIIFVLVVINYKTIKEIVKKIYDGRGRKRND